MCIRDSHEPHLPEGLGRLRRAEQGLCGVLPGRQAGAVLHPVRPGAPRLPGGDRHHRPHRQALNMSVTANGRTSEYDVDPMFLERWSPRAFTGEAMPDAVLMSLFEAAHWAPSAFNGQPWRFVYAHRGGADWDRLFEVLIPYNQAWVKNASVLMYAISDRFRRAEGREPVPVRSHASGSYTHLRAH